MIQRATAMCGTGATLTAIALAAVCSPTIAATRPSLREAPHSLAAAGPRDYPPPAPPAPGPTSWREGLFGAPPPPDDRSADAPLVAHYEADEGEAFTLDRAEGRPALMRFDGNPEIWALRPSPGPRGDIIYKNDLGEPMLRATRLGGLTLFTPDRPGGSAAAMAGPAPSLRPITVNNLAGLTQVLNQAMIRVGRTVQHQMRFEIAGTDDTPAVLSLFADAALLTAKAFGEVAGSGPAGQTQAARFDKVTFDQAKKVNVRTKGETVQITVAPAEGLMGRPSSRRIERAISGK